MKAEHVKSFIFLVISVIAVMFLTLILNFCVQEPTFSGILAGIIVGSGVIVISLFLFWIIDKIFQKITKPPRSDQNRILGISKQDWGLIIVICVVLAFFIWFGMMDETGEDQEVTISDEGSGTQQTYSCPDGTVVKDFNDCPKTWGCPNGTIVYTEEEYHACMEGYETEKEEASVEEEHEVPESEEQEVQWMEKAITMRVYAESYNWDTDAEDDGLRININLIDEDLIGLNYDEPATFDITIFASESSGEEHDIIYSGRHEVDSLTEVSHYSNSPRGKGIFIEYDDMKMDKLIIGQYVASTYVKVKVSALRVEAVAIDGEELVFISETELP
jgi:hypothetical protein